MYKSFVVGLLILTVHQISAQDKKNVFDAPDQVVWHEGSKSWYVSNLGGGVSFARDGYGWITKLDKNGKTIDSNWVKGLDAPSGMVTFDNKLFVCDRIGVLEIDIKKAKVTNTYPVPGAEMINDIAIAANGDIYVSDFFGDKIYKLPAKTRKAVKFLDIPDSPDGLLVDKDQLLIVTWGKITDRSTFATSHLGNLLTVDLKTKAVKPFLNNVKYMGNLEGITKAGDSYYITDWMAGKLLRVTKKNGVEEVLSGLKNPTDLDYAFSLKTLAFPEHGDNRVYMLKLAGM